jgi:type VI secretion system protein VasI
MNTKKVVGSILLGTFVVLTLVTLNLLSRRSRAAQGPPATPEEKWTISIGRSSMDDSRTVVLALDSEDKIQGPLGTVTPSLIVRCQEKKTEVYVATGMAASVESHGEYSIAPEDSHTVRTRLDDAVASTEYWSESGDHKALFAERDSIEFAKALSGASTFTFQFTPFDASPQTAQFNVGGLGPHLHKLAEACGWAY